MIKYDEYGKFDGTTDAPVLVNGNSSVHFQTQFTYLGSVLDHMLSDIPDVKARVKKASGLFGALNGCLFKNKAVSKKTKVKVMNTLVMSTVLYGCKSWSFRESTFDGMPEF